MATAATLNPEPSLQAAQNQRHLPPNSYVNGTIQTSYDSSSTQEFYAGEGEDETLRSPRRKMQKRTGSPRVSGHHNEKHKSSVIIERFEDNDGEHLTSLRPGWDSQRNKETRKSIQLVSGRKAGARWEQSQ